MQYLRWLRKRREVLDFTGGMRHLQFDITHLCNRYCPLCDHRIKYSDYTYLTKEDYERIVGCIEDRGDILEVHLGGGEPLCHPHFDWLVARIREDFTNARVMLSTNGRLLPKLGEETFALLDGVTISHYQGWNDEVVAAYGEREGVRVLPRPTGCFWDPYRDPDLDEKTAKRVRARCYHDIRIVGTRLYGCRIAEPAERYYKTEPVHVEFGPNWKEDWRNLPTWKACQHCFRSIDWPWLKE